LEAHKSKDSAHFETKLEIFPSCFKPHQVLHCFELGQKSCWPIEPRSAARKS